MGRLISLGLVLALLGSLTGCGRSRPRYPAHFAYTSDGPTTSLWDVAGRTQPSPGRQGVIAPIVLHPVKELLVKPGDRVKKGQPLIQLDDAEARADVRSKEAILKELHANLARVKAEPRQALDDEARGNLESAKASVESARKYLEALTPLWEVGAVAEQRFREVRAALARAQSEERAAASRVEQLRNRPFTLEIAELEAKLAAAIANLDAARAELDHCSVPAPIEGVVGSLNVHPGTVAQPGRSVWGEVLDLSELDVRCDVTPALASLVRLDQKADITTDREGERLPGKVVFIGSVVDPATGNLPVLVRVANPGERLRCNVPVRVAFGPAQSEELTRR